MLHDTNSLMYLCFKARYFPRSHFLEATESQNCSFVWKSIMAALPTLKSRCCWRVGSRHSIQVLGDKWIPNYQTNSIIHSAMEDIRDALVSELINQELHLWRSDFIMEMFEKEDAEAICRILLSRRYVEDSIVWLPNKKGLFTVKSAYKVTREAACPMCTRFPETVVHVFWECDAAQDVWAGSLKSLQKGVHGMTDMVQLLEYLMERLALEDIELVLVQAWFIESVE